MTSPPQPAPRSRPSSPPSSRPSSRPGRSDRAPVIRVAADGSAGSRRALAWARDEAALRHCDLQVVTAYQPRPGESPETARRKAQHVQQATVTGVLDPAEARVVTARLVEGHPVEVLVRESERSHLLVMGSHGVSGLIHSALGSVADSCGRMASCPVVIVPPGADPGRRPEEPVTEPADGPV